MWHQSYGYMKWKRIVLLVLGWFFIIMQLLNYLTSAANHQPLFEQRNLPYIIGYNITFIAGIGFLLWANRYKHKMRRQKELKKLDELFDETNSFNS